MVKFDPPNMSENVEGWGPALDIPPEKFRDMPYAPFSKSDRLGRAADWTNQGRHGRYASIGLKLFGLVLPNFNRDGEGVCGRPDLSLFVLDLVLLGWMRANLWMTTTQDSR
mmetsp:Transcript_24332/g.95782  ORF Transcript_24332/g.95782 Transcript_24332/m.95782 type:complete len:111 (+) Transcript_24332:176-508(+)